MLVLLFRESKKPSKHGGLWEVFLNILLKYLYMYLNLFIRTGASESKKLFLKL